MRWLMLRGALATGWSASRGGSTASRAATIRRAVFEGEAIERALFWGRCSGGLIILFLGPVAAPSAPLIAWRVLGIYFVAYAALMVWLTRRASTPSAREGAQWLAHTFDTIGFLAALVLSATGPSWLAVNAAPLYILVAVARLGVGGGVIAAVALAVTHVALAIWREVQLGIHFDSSHLLVQVAVYGLAALLASALDVELRALRAKRDLQVAVHEPLLQAHDDLRQGVIVSEAGRPVYVSDGLTALTGWSRDEIMAMSSVMELIPEDERAAAIALTKALPPAGGNLTKRLRRKGGDPIEVDVALRRYEQDGQARSVAIVRDVTVRIRTLEELGRMQRLDGLGALTSGIAHDFNNLLAVIVNNAYVALDSTDGPARRELQQIREVAQHGVDLTRRMLAFASGVRMLPARPIDVAGEVTSAEQLLRRAVDARIGLDVRVARDVSCVLLGAGQIQQILMNLVVNARDAMPDGGRVAIRVADVELDGSQLPPLGAGRYVRIVVEDDGVGMSPEVASHVFEPFFTTKPKDHGTGLGLSTVYGVVRSGGGHVGLSSSPGRGTTVTVHLPAIDGGGA